MDTAPYLIEPLVLPAAIDSPDAGEFLEFVELSDALVLETWGDPDRSSPAKARLQYWRDNPYTRPRLFFVRVDGRMVAPSGALSYDAESWDVARVRHVEKTWKQAGVNSLVASHHRGHRLGMLVKILNIRRLLSGYPAVERIITFNAAENDHMLSINVTLGFRPAGYDGECQKAP